MHFTVCTLEGVRALDVSQRNAALWHHLCTMGMEILPGGLKTHTMALVWPLILANTSCLLCRLTLTHAAVWRWNARDKRSPERQFWPRLFSVMLWSESVGIHGVTRPNMSGVKDSEGNGSLCSYVLFLFTSRKVYISCSEHFFTLLLSVCTMK